MDVTRLNYWVTPEGKKLVEENERLLREWEEGMDFYEGKEKKTEVREIRVGAKGYAEVQRYRTQRQPQPRMRPQGERQRVTMTWK